MKIAIGTKRDSKIKSVQDAAARIATVDDAWLNAHIISRSVEVSVPAMPLSDEDMMAGARERANAVRTALENEGERADLYVGIEGGFHTIELNGENLSFLRGWVYASDGNSGFFGSSPSVTVPNALARRVIGEGVELGVIIDEFAGQADIRSRQGAWGVFSLDLITRSMSFEAALIAAFAPFYNAQLYPRADEIRREVNENQAKDNCN